MGFNTSSNYLPGSASKKETFTPKPKVENAVKTPSIGETYRAKTGNINAPLPGSKPQTQTSPMYKPEAPKLKLNLPTTLERDFAKGALGDEREREVYNFDILDRAAKAGYLKDTRTEKDFFNIGFNDLEDTPKYAFTDKADDNVKGELFSILDFGANIPKNSHLGQFIERYVAQTNENIRYEKANGEQYLNSTEPSSYSLTPTEKQRKFVDVSKDIIDVARLPFGAVEELETLVPKFYKVENPAGIVSRARRGEKAATPSGRHINSSTVTRGRKYDTPRLRQRTNVREITHSLDDVVQLPDCMKSGSKAASALKIADGVFSVLDFGLSVKEDLENGETLTSAVLSSAADSASTYVGGYLGGKGGAYAGAALGTAICPGLGTVIGGAIGFVAGNLLGG